MSAEIGNADTLEIAFKLDPSVLDGRFNVAREDIATSAKLVLRHRLITNYRAEADQVTVDSLIGAGYAMEPSRHRESEQSRAMPEAPRVRPD